MNKIRVTIWNEFRHEKNNEKIRKVYPCGIHNALANGIKCEDFEIKKATLDEPEHGLSEETLENTDVLIWWGHCAHSEVKDEIVKRAQTIDKTTARKREGSVLKNKKCFVFQVCKNGESEKSPCKLLKVNNINRTKFLTKP